MTDFSRYLTSFLTGYLPGEKGASTNTVCSYRDTFVLFLEYCRDKVGITAEKLDLKQIDIELVCGFLDWVESERGCSAATRNVRLAAIHSFFKYIQYRFPEQLGKWQQIMGIPVKKTLKPNINYLSVESMKLLLEEPDQGKKSGRRDLAMLALMYDCGCRVQEIIDLTPSMLRLDPPCTVKLIGKGGKARIVPLKEEQTVFLKKYMHENKLDEPHANKYPLFCNNRKTKLTRAGVNYILNKYLDIARMKKPTMFPEGISCHGIRHSSAMHMLQSGVNLVYIRDILGHSSVQVTEVYARVDSKQKREAIEKAYYDILPESNTPSWQSDCVLLDWLKNFNK